MASDDRAPQDGGNSATTQSDADTKTVKIIDIICKRSNWGVRVPSKLTNTQSLFVLILIYVIFTIFHLEPFLLVLGIIAIIVLWKALCLLKDYMIGKFKFSAKSERTDLENQSLASKPVTKDLKDVSEAQEFEHDDGQIPEALDRETKGPYVHVKGETETKTAHRGRRAAEGETKKVVRKCFRYIKEKVSSDWVELAWTLGFSQSEIGNIRAWNRDDKSRCMNMLEELLKREGSEATMEILMKALFDARLESVVYDLRSQYPELRNVATQQE